MISLAMDVKDLRSEATLGEQKNDGSKYPSNSGTVPSNRNKSYQDADHGTMGKMDVQAARPCAVIGPDRVLPAVPNDSFKKGAYESWCQDNMYRHPPEYSYKMSNYQTPLRNISPRQTFQENMQRIMVPPTYNSFKENEETADKNGVPKNVKTNIPSETKYCEVPYSVNATNNDPKNIRNGEHCISSVNPVLTRSAPHGWPSNVRPLRPYGAPELYPYPDYANCLGPRPMSTRPHRTVHEETGHVYPETYYHDGNIRYKPYPAVKERYPHTRYEYIGNYPNPFHPPSSFSQHKYDLQKPFPPPYAYPQVPIKFQLDGRIGEPTMDNSYQRPNQQGPYNLPFRNQMLHPAYGAVMGNCIPNKYQCPPDGSTKPAASNKLPYNNNKMYVDYENARPKHFPVSENFYLNDMQRSHIKGQMMPNYPTMNVHGISSHPFYRKDNIPIKNYDYMYHRNMEPSMVSLPRISTQFSPNSIAISPSDLSVSNDTTQVLGNSQEDCGYVSQSPTASIRSMDSILNRNSNDFYRRYDPRYGPNIRTSPMMTKSEQNSNNGLNSKHKKDIDVRQFLQMWSEVDDENGESSTKDMTPLHSSDITNKIVNQHEILKNQDQLYVLGLVNVPSDELSKYEHIQKVSKLPENIKGYNNIELLNQFEEVIQSSITNNFSNSKLLPVREIAYNQIPIKTPISHQITGSLQRPVSPLDVEAKISQSVIHKEVGCNFEIKPCSPKMLNVEVATPVQNLIGERAIEKVTNPLGRTSPMLNNDKNLKCNVINQGSRNTTNEQHLKISSCKMASTQFVSNDPIRPNYSLQDLESNSGVCLASLPRLDNDIELNFPEVNQQFINANKGESVITATTDLPPLSVHQSESSIEKNKEYDSQQEMEVNHDFSTITESEREFSKLSRYRKIKKNIESMSKDAQSLSPSNVRTDSVIIKNPENKINDDREILENQSQENLEQNCTTKSLLQYQNLENNETCIEIEPKSLNNDENIAQTSNVALDFSINKTKKNKQNVKSLFSTNFNDSRDQENNQIQRNSTNQTETKSELKENSFELQEKDNKIKNDINENLNEELKKMYSYSEKCVYEKLKNSFDRNSADQNETKCSSDTKKALGENVEGKKYYKHDEQKYFNNDINNSNCESGVIMKQSNSDKKDLTSKLHTYSQIDINTSVEKKICRINNIDETSSNNTCIENDKLAEQLNFIHSENNIDLEKISVCGSPLTKNMEVVDSDIGIQLNDKQGELPDTSVEASFDSGTHRVNIVNRNKEDISCSTSNLEESVLEDKHTLETLGPFSEKATELSLNGEKLLENNKTIVKGIPDPQNLESSNLMIKVNESVVYEYYDFNHHNRFKLCSINKELFSSRIQKLIMYNEGPTNFQNKQKEHSTIKNDEDHQSNQSHLKTCIENIYLNGNNDLCDMKCDTPKQINVDADNVVISTTATPLSLRRPMFLERDDQKTDEDAMDKGLSLKDDTKDLSSSKNDGNLHNEYPQFDESDEVKSKDITFENNENIASLSHSDIPQSPSEISNNLSSAINSDPVIGSNLNDKDQQSDQCEINKIKQNNVSVDKDFFLNTIEECSEIPEPPGEISIELEEESNGIYDTVHIATCVDTVTINDELLNPSLRHTYLKNKTNLKRSLSDTALEKINKENNDEFNFMWQSKRRKKDAQNIVQPQVIENSFCNRRNSLSSFYNEENVSFCILIDNNCIIEEDDKEQEKICFTEITEDCVPDAQNRRNEITEPTMDVVLFSQEDHSDCHTPELEENNLFEETSVDDIITEPPTDVVLFSQDHSECHTPELVENKSFDETWVDDIACVETVVSDDIAEDIVISNPSSPREAYSPEYEEPEIFMNCEHTDKVKHIYGNKMCNDDIQFLETLYRTPQMNVNKTLINRESHISEESNQYYNKDSLEKLLSDSNSNEGVQNELRSPGLCIDSYSPSECEMEKILSESNSCEEPKIKFESVTSNIDSYCPSDNKKDKLLSESNTHENLDSEFESLTSNNNSYCPLESKKEKILSESNSCEDLHSEFDSLTPDVEPYFLSDCVQESKYNDKENVNSKILTQESSTLLVSNKSPKSESFKVEHNNSESNKSTEKMQDVTINSCESTIDNVFTYDQREEEYTKYTTSSSPEVSSTTSEEKNSSILLKITNYNGSRVSQVNDLKHENKKISCKFTEISEYSSHNSLLTNRPLITKAAQKYIPPLKETIGDLKIRLPLPQRSLLRLKQLKLLKDEPKSNKYNLISKKDIPKKPKPKFEDVLKSIDEIQFKMHKNKGKKAKKVIPKVVIKKNENGSHYASTTTKKAFNPDLTGRKWQPWVFLEKNLFIDKMALRNKKKAIYNHRKNTYVLAEKFRKYRSIGSAKFVISQPNFDDSSIGQLKCTIRLKHTY